MTQAIDKVIWTISDLDVFPDSEDKYYEIIDGDLFVTRSPHRKHQQIIGRIIFQLENWNQKTGLGETIIAPGIIFSETDSVIPDLVWVSKARLAQIEDSAGHLIAAPELVVEVISPGTNQEKRDREVKLKLYSVQGVQEYWIVDRFLNQVEVYRRQQAKLVLSATLFKNDVLNSPLLPDFEGNINLFFPE
ncbi:Uma2 family endonuclease [Geminocystis sp. GBBB08]|uniref:Uma2 family endonuclease n=1 Tax=Geminocystis sp. GBBB08 TaxID=2604140 RepID=UPI0027E2E851|nr:Uma2 family endonuclease [Geminocystis sp. GBBB08]MBL1211507.1 Uma2 family endonuclease [Geminocystis sp. GBBB08]